jgi:1-acyl-sn-glycerol-3-phosphate acyltransferase
MPGSSVPQPDFYLRLWDRTFALAERWFRYECQGFEHLTSAGRSCLLVAYHGMPVPWDVFIMARHIVARFGYFPHAVWLKTWHYLPFFRSMVPALGGVYGPPSVEHMRGIKERGEHFFVAPGGAREGLRPAWRRYQVDWGSRRGYLRMALDHDLPIIPIACDGIDRCYIGLNDGYRLSKRLFGYGGIPLWLAIGLGGLFPLALPFPIKLRQRIGPPIDLAPLRSVCGSEEELLSKAHILVSGAVQQLLDELVAP